MNRQELLQLFKNLPEDASDIIIRGAGSRELFFNSAVSHEDLRKVGATPAQKGTYRGPLKRWCLTSRVILDLEGIPIDPDTISEADADDIDPDSDSDSDS